MTQLDDRPEVQTDREERVPAWAGPEIPRERSSTGRAAATILLLATITLMAAAVGYALAGGRLSSHSQSQTGESSSGVVSAPAALTATSVLVSATAPPRAPAAPKAESKAPAPTAPPTTVPAAPPTAVPAVPAAAAKPAVSEVAPTVVPAPPAPPTAVPQPTALPPTDVPKPANPAPAPAPAEKPASAPAAPQGAMVPIRPGTDARKAQIEGRINEYFDALGDEDFARAQSVCCTPEWRARYPLERWQRNFDGVTDLRLTNPPRYLQVQDDLVVVDTDYTFVSGGARRNFTVRWTFKPAGSEWQADLAEAFPQ